MNRLFLRGYRVAACAAVLLLILASCAGQQAVQMPEESGSELDAILSLDFYEMSEDAFCAAIAELGWTEFADSSYFLGQLLGYRAYLTCSINPLTEKIGTVNLTTSFYHESERETQQALVDTLAEDEWREQRACVWFEGEVEQLAAQWLLAARAAMAAAGGSIETEHPVQAPGDTEAELAEEIRSRFAAASDQLKAGIGDQFYLFENRCSCSLTVSAITLYQPLRTFGTRISLYDPSAYFGIPAE